MTVNGLSRHRSGRARELRFLEVYNDIATYPALEDVARKLGRSRKTVINYASILRARRAAGVDLPEPVSRRETSSEPRPTLTPLDHAGRRAERLQSDVRALVTASAYPVVNPEAIVVRGQVNRRYDRLAGAHVEIEGKPHTWLADTLRVAPIADARCRSFIFSGAQNDTPVDPAFWANLEAYAAWTGSELVIGAWTYETSWWSENAPSSRVYDPRIARHLCFGQLEIGETFVFCGEMNTLPTAARPISDLTSYARGRWAVFPHARLQLVSVPSTDPLEQAAQVITTGAVTRPMVIPRKAGVKALFHHQLAAVIVEFDAEGDVFCRHLIADEDGGFQDLDIEVRNGRVFRGGRIAVLTPGDIHVAKTDPVNMAATFGFDPDGRPAPGSILEVLNPAHLCLHDIHDHESRNHHHENDVSHALEMAERGRDSVMEEIGRSAALLVRLAAGDREVHVVESNHDLALERYVREGRYRGDGVNLRFGLRLDLAYHDWRAELARDLEAGRPPSPFSLLEWAIRDILPDGVLDNVSWIYDGTSEIIDGVEHGNHGFRGANGTKGTVAGYARLGRPMTIGDKHTPAILDRVYGAGTMQLRMGYNKGISGWAVSHVVQYRYGGRTHVTLQNGKWRAPRRDGKICKSRLT